MASKFEIEERRQRVYEMKCSGLSKVAIAKMLQCSRNTVANDLEAIRKDRAKTLKDADAHEEIGAKLRFLEEIRTKALIDYGLTPEKSPLRSGYLNTALRAEQMATDLMLQTGMLPKVADKIQVEQLYEHNGADIRKMGLDELKQAAQDLMSSLPQALVEAVLSSNGGMLLAKSRREDKTDDEKDAVSAKLAKPVN
jgi:hypothetical protein